MVTCPIPTLSVPRQNGSGRANDNRRSRPTSAYAQLRVHNPGEVHGDGWT